VLWFTGANQLGPFVSQPAKHGINFSCDGVGHGASSRAATISADEFTREVIGEIFDAFQARGPKIRDSTHEVRRPREINREYRQLTLELIEHLWMSVHLCYREQLLQDDWVYG
jgi:hypothetical protein